jgi:trk system potassium uptake protein TrkH
MFHKVSIVNWKMLVRVMGWLLMIEAAFMVIPLIIALVYDDEDFMQFVYSIAITLSCGVFATFCVRPKRYDMGKREGFLLTASVWLVFSIFGMIPFMLDKHPLSLTDAFFEAMSGFTTTGATIMANLEDMGYGLHLWRALMQWIGGMGIILFTLAVLPMLNSSGGMQMFNAEVTGITHEKLRPRVSATAKRLWLIYFLLTTSLFLLYWAGPMSGFESICHAMSTMSTGGFSTDNESINAWNSLYIKVVTIVFMFIGGVNFTLIYRASTGRYKEVWSNEVFRFYVWTILGMLVVFDLFLVINPEVNLSIYELTIDPLFQIVATLSSTGYTVPNLDLWGSFILGLVVLMMFFGACAGSTSGGAKLDRAMLLWKNCRNELTRCIYPNHILSADLNKKAVAPELINKVMVFLSLYITVILIGGGLLTICGASLGDAYFSAFSCVSNTGIDASLSCYGVDYNYITNGGKWILSFLMLTGRLEIFTILVILTPRFWKK